MHQAAGTSRGAAFQEAATGEEQPRVARAARKKDGGLVT